MRDYGKDALWLPDKPDDRVEPGSFFVTAQCPHCKWYVCQTWRPGVHEREEAVRDVKHSACNCPSSAKMIVAGSRQEAVRLLKQGAEPVIATGRGER